MLQKDFNAYINEMSEDIEGLQRIVCRIKERNESFCKNSQTYQELDIESVNLYVMTISETISQLENCVLRGENNVEQRL